MKRVAIVSDISSQLAVEPLALQLQAKSRQHGTLSSLAFDTDSHTIHEALATGPAVLMVVLGAPNSAYQGKINALLSDWQHTPKRQRPALILLSSDDRKTRAAFDDWRSKHDPSGELSTSVSIFSEGLNALGKLTHTLETSLSQHQAAQGLGFENSSISIAPPHARNNHLLASLGQNGARTLDGASQRQQVAGARFR